MKKEDEKLKLRLEAISMVNMYKPVLSKEEYVTSLNLATKIYPKSEPGGETLGTIIFGEGEIANLNRKMDERLEMLEILTDDSVPPAIRILFVTELQESGVSWQEFKQPLLTR